MSALSLVKPFMPAGDQGENRLGRLASQYMAALLRGQRREAAELIMAAVDDGVSVKDVYLGVFQPSLYEVGRLWQTNQISVAEEHYFTAATQLVMSYLYPRIFGTAQKDRTIVAACAGGELHEVGMRMVADFFEMEGWDSYYLGANTPHDSLVKAVREKKPHVLALSATMSFQIPAVGKVIREVREDAALDGVKILAGGYCFRVDPDLWRRLGADATAADAQQAVEVADRLVGAA